MDYECTYTFDVLKCSVLRAPSLAFWAISPPHIIIIGAADTTGADKIGTASRKGRRETPPRQALLPSRSRRRLPVARWPRSSQPHSRPQELQPRLRSTKGGAKVLHAGARLTPAAPCPAVNRRTAAAPARRSCCCPRRCPRARAAMCATAAGKAARSAQRRHRKHPGHAGQRIAGVRALLLPRRQRHLRLRLF